MTAPEQRKTRRKKPIDPADLLWQVRHNRELWRPIARWMGANETRVLEALDAAIALLQQGAVEPPDVERRAIEQGEPRQLVPSPGGGEPAAEVPGALDHPTERHPAGEPGAVDQGALDHPAERPPEDERRGTLRELVAREGITLYRLAQLTGRQDGDVARLIRCRRGTRLGSVRAVVGALGGRFELRAVFEGRSWIINIE